MPRITLHGAPYQGRSRISSGQEAVNLYAESNQGDPTTPVPITWYGTPGSTLYSDPSFSRNVRQVYRTSLGTGAYVVIGPKVYFLDPSQTLTQIGTIADLPSRVSITDNGLTAVLVDGSTNGYAIDLVTNRFAPIVDPSFYGADYALFLDTFFVFNRPLTNQFYISLSEVTWGMLSGTAVGNNGIIVGGAAYVNGTYSNVPLTGGTGTGATATITVAGNTVTVVQLDNFGAGYLIGDILSASNVNLGGAGAGFTYTNTSFQLAFDPLDIAAKSGSPDPIVGIATVHQELWLIGALTTEIWIGTGAADFFFQQVQGAYINHGCSAQYSIADQDTIVFWLMQDRQGQFIVVMGQGYDISEISTPRLIKEFEAYTTTSDAIGFTYQVADHAFYALIFPTANKGWLYDLKTKWWNEWNWTDNNGNLNRPRANCCMFVYGSVVVGDWQNGRLLKLDPDVYTDVDVDRTPQPITRIKTFPHQIGAEFERVTYNSFDADMEAGTDPNMAETPLVFLSWSDDRGVTFQNPVPQTIGQTGQYLTTISWNRLGMARDRVFKLEWSAPVRTALNGGFTEVIGHKT